MADSDPARSGVPETGAMAQLSRDPSSRKRFLKMVGGTGAAGAFALFLAACGSDDDKKSGATTSSTTDAKSAKADLDIVNYALTLEYLETDFYGKVVDSGLFKGSDLETIKRFGAEEQEHVDALTAFAKQLGGTPAAKPKTKFPLDDAKSVLELAATVENLGAAAYLGQAGKIQSKAILAAALSIHTVEGRHASALNLLLKKSVTPDGPFAKPASMEAVMQQVKPFIVS